LEARIAPAFAAVVELSSLNGFNGFTINGVAANDLSGYSVSAAGDVNGDGFDDVIIGAVDADANGSDSGASYVVFGKVRGFAANLNLSTLDGSDGFELSGVAAGDNAGRRVSGAGDINGDGFDDVIVGAKFADANGGDSGASYVVFGKASGFLANLNLSTLNGGNGFRIGGASPYDISGYSVSAAGDVNGDGFDDVIIGARNADHQYGAPFGASYVVFGKASGFAANLNLSTLNGTDGFKLGGVAQGDLFGYSVSAAGDVNGDGFDDVLIGARNADSNGSYSGASYVVFGKASGFAANLNLSTLNGSNGFKLSGGAASDFSGHSVSAAGDVNRDGFGDLIIGAVGADPNGSYSGASYVILGKASFAANLNLSTLNGSDGFKLNGAAAGDYSGGSVSDAGDVNGDGFGDLIIGAAGTDANGSASGASYVVFGKASGFAADLNLSALNGSDGFKLSGAAAGDYSGVSVSDAGDVNGDGFGDLIIGAWRANPHGKFSGASYVVFGRGIEINVSDAVATEGDNGTTALEFTVSLSEAGTVPVTLEVTAFEGTAHVGSDYAALDQSGLTFAPGETSKTVTINVIGDALHESDETLSLVLSNVSGGIVKDGNGLGTILNDDAPPLVSITGGTVLEGDIATSSLALTVSLSVASGLPVAVNFASADGTALTGSDYTGLAPGTLNFAPGETTKTITVDILGDTRIEDHETFLVVLSEPSGATIGADTASGTILNDDTALRIAGPADSLEGDSGTTPLVFTVTLEKASALPVTVTYATADGTANAGSDFIALEAGAQISFAPGETIKTITVDVIGDTSVEAHETFSLVLSNPANATIAEGAASATILNDDTLIRVDDASVLEGHTVTRAMTFAVTLSAPSALPVSVNFASADGTATAGADYAVLTPGTLNFAPGEMSKTVTVDVLGDVTVEPTEIFSLVLSGAVNAVIDDGTAIGTILDDDVTLVSPHKATFVDIDGELATIKVSKGTLAVQDFTLVPSGQGAQLALVDFSGQSDFAGAKLSVKATRAAGISGADRRVDVGAINATGIDLGKVIIKGDLGQIDAGNDAAPQPGVHRLNASSFGARGLETQLPGGSLQSEIIGAIKQFKLSEDMRDATLSVSADIGAIAIKGGMLDSTIRSDGKIGAIKIGGDLAGATTSAATISARGILAPTSTGKALAIAALSIGGSIDHAQILAGYDRSGAAVNADASIGPVRVAHNWTASDLIAGAAAGSDALFGTDDDALIARGNPIVAKIASIVIKGTAAGTDIGSDHFGFVSEEIGAFKSGGTKLTLTPGPSNDLTGIPIASGANLTVREVI
jgi:hypothetical protein